MRSLELPERYVLWKDLPCSSWHFRCSDNAVNVQPLSHLHPFPSISHTQVYLGHKMVPDLWIFQHHGAMEIHGAWDPCVNLPPGLWGSRWKHLRADWHPTLGSLGRLVAAQGVFGYDFKWLELILDITIDMYNSTMCIYWLILWLCAWYVCIHIRMCI